MMTFELDLLPLLADDPSSVTKLRELIIELAVSGRLVPQKKNDESVSKLLEGFSSYTSPKSEQRKKVRKKPTSDPLAQNPDLLLPNGWASSRLGNISEIFNGNSIKSSDKDEKYRGGSGRPYIATKDVGYGRDVLDYQNGIFIPDDEPGFKVAIPGAVLICAEGGSAGKKCGLVDREVCFGNKLFAVEPFEPISSEFLLLYFLSNTFQQRFADLMTGIIGGVSLSKFTEILIELPPAAEQQRIVSKAHQLMAMCDSLIERQSESQNACAQILGILLDELNQDDSESTWLILTEKFGEFFSVQPGIDALKRAILQLATKGSLVPQMPNEGHFEQALTYVKSLSREDAPYPIPSNWQWMKLSDLLITGRDISYGIIKLGNEPVEGGVPTLRCSDVKPGYIKMDNVRSVEPAIEHEYARTRLSGGEIVINIRGTLGGVAVVDKSLAGYNVAREVAVIPLNESLSARYIVSVMQSDYFWKRINDQLRGIAYKGLNLGDLRLFPLPIPPLAEQLRIVQKLDSIMQLCGRLEKLIELRNTLKIMLLDLIIDSALNDELR